jgi:hypothetical protein
MPAQDEDRRLDVLLAQPGTPDAPTPAAPESHTLRPDAAPQARKCPRRARGGASLLNL